MVTKYYYSPVPLISARGVILGMAALGVPLELVVGEVATGTDGPGVLDLELDLALPFASEGVEVPV